MTVFDLISMLGGLALFLYGMEVMGDGLKNCSGTALKKVLEKVTQNAITGVIVGTLVTAVIQSSTATIVLTVGLLGAGILTLRQSVSIVMGANIGTTITAQIIRLMDIDSSGMAILEFFKPTTLAPLAAIVGIILVMFVKTNRSKSTGSILMGFGILFIGLLNMTAAVEPLSQSPGFLEFITKFSDIPVLGIIVGLVLTIIVQSSSAMVGMLQALSSTGIIKFSLVYPLIMGINLGTCVTTAIVCSIGTNDDAKRTGAVHIAFNCIGTIIFMIIMTVIRHMGFLPDLWNNTVTSGGIANFQTIFNLVTAIILVPFTNQLVKLSYRIIKPNEAEKEDYSEFDSLDEKLFISPALAVRQSTTAVAKMAEIAYKNIKTAFSQLGNYDASTADKISARENRIDDFADLANNYLIKLAGHIEDEDDNKQLNVLIQSITDFERIGDYATNIEEIAKHMHEDNLEFSDAAKEELKSITGALYEILDTTLLAFKNDDIYMAKRIEPLEEVVDELVDILRDRHTSRLKSGVCTISVGLMFIELLTNIERAADQCSNVGVFILGKTSDKILNSHHTYLRELHKGSDPIYSNEFNEKYDKYITPLLKHQDV